MNILVAGANGFIGMNLVLSLLRKGHHVVMSYRDDLTAVNEKVLAPYGDQVVFCKGDLLEKSTFDKLAEYPIDAIINGAIMTSTGDDELSYFIPMCKINLQTNVNLMEFALRKKVKRYLYISSSGVYGSYSNPGDCVYEDSQLDLFSTYCVTKYASELLVAQMGRLSGMETVTARIAAPYGPFERVTDGRTHMSAVYKMVHMALRGEPAVIYGKDVVRDWTYVSDTVQAITRLIEAKELKYDVYNVSTSVDVSLQQIAEAVKKACGSFRYEFTDCLEKANVAMLPEQQRGALSIKRLQEDTDYQVEYDIFRGVQEYYQILAQEAEHV